ncbi:hypothetical protein BP6252_08507 [Coleophoma cylindrospora]|uniref:Transmembrane protein 42 n=1 Tax=Coleophoma cylindrospora TaxID=1849047 RepID=A0A3D8R658_9HELO|nr:hypothetical protein BP6252_08507 [Coleophoma cylindrospora]
MLRQRPAKNTSSSANTAPFSDSAAAAPNLGSTTTAMESDNPSRPLLATVADDHSLSEPLPSYSSTLLGNDETAEEMDLSKASRKTQWILLAVASGACAAFNGVFAKLTTTELTTSFATSIANLLGLGNGEKVVEVIVRAIFFGLNLIFNGVMWALFTKALARGTSTTQVSIINTSSNFMITAVLGFIIFSESLPPLWWLGASMLVAGNVIIGRREEKDESADEHTAAENGEGSFQDEAEGLLAEDLELVGDVEESVHRRKEDDDTLILDLDREGAHDERTS